MYCGSIPHGASIPPTPAAEYRLVRATARALLVAAGLVLALGGTRTRGGWAGEGEAEGTGTYSVAELEALDRALHAANMDRRDLGFRKDLAAGHERLAVIEALLKDPLEIAREVDRWAALSRPSQRLEGLLQGAALALRRPGEPQGARTPTSLPPAPATAQAALAALADALGRAHAALPSLPQADAQAVRALRQGLPAQLDWHDVYASPYGQEEATQLKAFLEEAGEAWLHEQAARINVQELVRVWTEHIEPLLRWAIELPLSAFPTDAPLTLDTPHGRVALGTTGDDVHVGEYALLIEPGGNDTYRHCRLGAGVDPERARIGLFVDRAGRDRYECDRVNLTLGVGVLGLGAALDLGAQDDVYEAGHGSLGAAMGGIGLFHDDGGSERYASRTFTQGAAGFGIAIFDDDAVQGRAHSTPDEGTPDPVEARLLDNDVQVAWANSQGFARCRGVALCLNRRGNDTYQAGGVYLHAPLFADRYQSFSQGFAIGERGIDYSGGLALLIDLEGNDRYLGDIYNQGVGYWYSAGLLYDGAGNDLYEMTQYGQGSGIHLAVGGLVDEGGSDTYVMHSGLGQGGSHDYAASVLHDRGGNDHYLGMTSCNGCGLTNSVGLHLDRSGDDTYAARKDSLNVGRAARGFSSIGVLLDLGGTDHYLGIQQDDQLWRHSDIGVGLDQPAPPAAPTPAGQPDAPAGEAPIPSICDFEGELTDAVFEELWEIAIRWEVGENRRIVPRARARLIAFGPPVLVALERVMDRGASGLELRAYQDVLAGLRAAGATQQVRDLLGRNLAATGHRQRVALHLVGELEERELEEPVAALLQLGDETLARRAAGVLERLQSRAGDGVFAQWIEQGQDELRVQAALGPWLARGVEAYPLVRPLLSHPLLSIRMRLVALLANAAEPLRAAWRADIAATDLPLRARRTLMDALTRDDAPGAGAALPALLPLVRHEDWGARGDALRALTHLAQAPAVAEPIREQARATLAIWAASDEADPYVRFLLGPIKAR